MVRGCGSWRLKSGGWRNPDGAGRRLSHRVLGCRAPEVDWSAGQPLLGVSFGIYRGQLLSMGSVKVDCFSGRDALLGGYEVGSFRW